MAVYRYPELYHELQKGRALSFRTFFTWLFQSIWQGGVIMLLSIYLFESSFTNIVAITYTALILSELLNVAYALSFPLVARRVCNAEAGAQVRGAPMALADGDGGAALTGLVRGERAPPALGLRPGLRQLLLVRLARLPPYRGLLPACVSVQVLHAPVCPERRP